MSNIPLISKQKMAGAKSILIKRKLIMEANK